METDDSACTDRVNAAFASVDRALFLPLGQLGRVHVDAPLPIGFDQTISQPSLVREMTCLLAPHSGSRVLEIGTGSGFQTAILAKLAATVFTIERVPELAAEAERRLRRLGCTNIHYRLADGACGWPEQAPFDRIMVTAAPATIPPALEQQLASGGRMVIPVGPEPDDQALWLVTRDVAGQLAHERLFPVRFVPLVKG
jgi:protein-L-isoaspartate(D-aspartate) O-methyltransferase